MNILVILFILLIALLVFAWLGLRIKPSPFKAFPRQPSKLAMTPLPADLPAPVERFYRQVYGENVPVIESAVVSGRLKLRVNGIPFQGRFRFTHDAGKSYRHYIEATFFGLPLMKVNEHFLEGKGRLELPFGVSEGAKVDQAGNLGMWGESIWFPALLVTDTRVRWEPIDGHTALLVIPFDRDEQRFVVRFDPETGMPHLLEAMRYKGEEADAKTLWINEALQWHTISGYMIPSVGAITWFDEGRPWAVFTVEELVYNVDVSEYIRARGP